MFQNKRFRYFYGVYNNTWKNERAVEIPVLRHMLKQYDNTDILEVGNVLGHYFTVNHTVVDKYEKGPRIINEDIVDFHPGRKYSLIFSISTMEHVGYDENVKDGLKILRGINNMKSLLKDKGKIVLTFPLGYNPSLDQLVKNGNIGFSQVYYLKRLSQNNRWAEGTRHDIQNAKYRSPFPGGNVLVIGVIY